MSTVMYKALRSAGVAEPLATAAAKQIPEEPATRADIAAVKSDIAALEVRLTWRIITIVGVYTGIVLGLVKFF